jgi:hypothetical protein
MDDIDEMIKWWINWLMNGFGMSWSVGESGLELWLILRRMRYLGLNFFEGSGIMDGFDFSWF